ncbi:MAG: dUTPase [Erysipelotrichaceae bacterium]|nr:dUTPase [Erysipelotrichaceae bacterium]
MSKSKTLKLITLFAYQKDLDEHIHELKGLTYGQTLARRKLAFLVELGELANKTRCFKYWSNQQSEERELLLDEYADGLHFLLSLGLATGVVVEEITYTATTSDLTTAFLTVYSVFNSFVANNDRKQYIALLRAFFALGSSLGFSEEEVKDAYLKKLRTNYRRQANNY